MAWSVHQSETGQKPEWACSRAFMWVQAAVYVLNAPHVKPQPMPCCCVYLGKIRRSSYLSHPYLELAVTSTDAAVADAGVLVAGDVVLGIDCDLADAVLLDLNLQLLHHQQSVWDH